MRILGIGATGFIGRHVLSLLVSEGHDVAVLHRGRTALAVASGVREIHGDRDQLADCRTKVERFVPDVILDMILYTEQQARELVNNFRGTVSRVVVASSADVYRNYDGLRGKATAPPDPPPLSEDAPLRETRYPYRGHDLPFAYAHDYDKILVEQVLLSEPDLPSTVLRLPAVFGPGDRQHRLRPYLERMSPHEGPILLEEAQARWRWTRGYVENIAAALALVVTHPGSGRVYNLGDEPTITEREWVEQIADVAGWDGDVVVRPRAELPDDLRQPLDWRYHLWTDSSKFHSELPHVPPVSCDEALRRTIEWEYSVRDGART